eukprot:SAG31_NODE_26051_length_449_cov_1.180000_1_plen_115_part_10
MNRAWRTAANTQVKPGKIDPYFHAMGASALLSFGAMYPYALGATIFSSCKQMPVVSCPLPMQQRSTSRRTLADISAASMASLWLIIWRQHLRTISPREFDGTRTLVLCNDDSIGC